MKFASLSLLAILLYTSVGFAQEIRYPIDSSYTVAGSFEKIKKDYPKITLAEIETTTTVEAWRDITYKRIGKRSLQLDLYAPKITSSTLRPVVLMIHGGGWASGTRSHMEVMAHDLARHGYVAIPITYRLSPEAKYPTGIEDLWDAVAWLTQNGAQYGADPRQLFVLGASAGAQLATLLGTTENDELLYKTARTGMQQIIRGIINVDGIVSFIHPEASQEGNAASRWLGGSRVTHWSNWTAASPLEYVDPSSPPILFINGSFPRFHAGRDDLTARYDEYGIYHDTLEFDDAPHTFWFYHPWYEPMMERIVQFLKR